MNTIKKSLLALTVGTAVLLGQCAPAGNPPPTKTVNFYLVTLSAADSGEPIINRSYLAQ